MPLAPVSHLFTFTNDRVGIENPADAFKFPSAGMIDLSIHQGQLVVYLFAHFLVVPFFVLAIIN